MQNMLHEIVANKRQEVAQRKEQRPLDKFADTVERADGMFLHSMFGDGLRIIAEIKPKSPSAGELREMLALEELMPAYSKYAAAISVLTDEKYFGGSFDLLKRVSAQTYVPTLCKDFVLDEYQIFEAREAGAQAVLLIAKILDLDELQALSKAVQSLNMTAVIEVQTNVELEKALNLNPSVVLINNRNLDTFEIDLATTEQLAPLVPKGRVKVISASGIKAAADITRLLSYTNLFLVGSSIMQSEHVEEKLQELSNAALVANGAPA